jgi:hypothetical protein
MKYAKSVMITLFLLVAASSAYGQCGTLVVNPTTGRLDCIGSGGGSGTVTSVVVAGTANQITASGTCTITTTGTCTLSLPSGLLIPGTINRLTLTAPATGATFTLIDGKTFTVNKSLTLEGTDSTTMTFPTTSATLARTDSANTFTGHQTIEGVTATGATGTGAMVYSISPAFTVSPTAPTQTAADNSTKLATTAYADAAALASTPKWSSILAPTANLSLSFGANSTTFTYNAATGSINGLKLTDTLNNTGSGILAYFSTASGSSMLPWQGDVNGVGFKVHTDGSFKSVGATTNGTLTLSGITSGGCDLSVANTAVSVTNTCGSTAKYIQGNSAQPAVNAASCTGATIGTGATNTAGTITGLPVGSCSVVLTFASATAATGWVCGVSDQTTANLFRQTASSTTTATLAGTSVSGDVLSYICAAY